MDINEITDLQELDICPWCKESNSFIKLTESTTRKKIECTCGCKVIQTTTNKKSRFEIWIPPFIEQVKANIQEKWIQN